MSVHVIQEGARPAHAVYRQSFSVSYDYPAHFTEQLVDRQYPVFAEALACREPGNRHRFVVFAELHVASSWPGLVHDIADYAEQHAETLHLITPPEVLVGGEPVKNDPALITQLQYHLCELGVDRHSYVLAIGGGALLEALGFVAVTTHRGIRHVRIPTTVLGRNDSGVGVRSGVNAFGIKNFVGAFAVLSDADFMRTLHPRDHISGVAEAVKVALIRDGAFFTWMEANAEALREAEPAVMSTMIRRCAELHMRQIAHGGDPFETGSARPLDYGHWSAHKLEALTHHELRHGEAVAIGLALSTRAARCRWACWPRTATIVSTAC